MLYYPQFQERFRTFLSAVGSKPVAVIGHARPDGDCIGSQVALARALRARGNPVVCVNADAVPRRLQYLVDDLHFRRPDQLPTDEAWIPVYVDCADQARAGEKARIRFPKAFANFDHHLSNDNFGEHNFVEATAAAACEILAGLLLDASLAVDAVTAKALFAGIMTDTGQFRFQATTEHTFRLTAELVARGARPAEAGGEIYERESLGKLQLLQRFLASLTLECGGRVCIGVLPEGVYTETGTNIEDAEGLVDYARAIDGVEIGVLLEERNGAVKGSLRAKDQVYRVDQLAALFGGGGHACAAGLNVKGVKASEVRDRLLAALPEFLAKAGV
ncbi:MAG: DHH family phosphoesterase [Opitutaceae bacterium]|nr:DHH family phosphoesterase [Opitutaceae bacterium]